MGIQLVWLKRDLRVEDHGALCGAAACGPVMCVYFYEPKMLGQPDCDPSHVQFVNECLAEVDKRVRERGGLGVVTRVADLPRGLETVVRELSAAGLGEVSQLWSHEETGNGASYARDIAVGRWCRERGVRWTEIWQSGVVRGLSTRDRWASTWAWRMGQAVCAAPERIDPPMGLMDAVKAGRFVMGGVRGLEELGLGQTTKLQAQRGGETRAAAELSSFLDKRGVGYQRDMSSPVEGWRSCSRISPYLAFGAISVRAVHHAASQRQAQVEELLRAGARVDRRWVSSLRSFQSRLRWHCHFMQKLESEPEIETRNMNRGYDGLREELAASEEAQRRLRAWQTGQTGYPMIDACMRCLHETGWVNFRMRAMLASFSAYHLWLHWREPSVYLARQFLDYEPGIHYSQFQMQSGVTGINTVRIYSPIKQALDQDPRGEFIRRWVPELERVPTEHLAEPEKMPGLTQRMAGCVIGEDYPEPIVDHTAAYNEAKRRVFEWRGKPEARAAAARVYMKHGSRKRTGRR